MSTLVPASICAIIYEIFVSLSGKPQLYKITELMLVHLVKIMRVEAI